MFRMGRSAHLHRCQRTHFRIGVVGQNTKCGGHIQGRTGDVLRSLSKKKMYGSPNSNPSPELGADKENHTSWVRYYQVSE